MNKYIHLTYRFSICIILNEITIFRKRISYCIFFFSNINLLKYIFYLFDKNINPFRSNEFLEFIKSNKKKWAKFKQNKITGITKKEILIENYINHPSYVVENALIGKYLQLINGVRCVGLLRKGDIQGEVIFRSFGIDKFYYHKIGSFYQRCKYIYKSNIILKNIKNTKKLCNFRLNKIDIGLTAYDTFMRYTGNPTCKEINFKLILFFSEAMFANDFFEKIFHNKNISGLVQSELQFIPLSILFQKFLLKKRKIYTRMGGHTPGISIRVYTNLNQRYKSRITPSKILLDRILNNSKTRKKSIAKINKYYKYHIKKKFYGQEVEEHKPEIINLKTSSEHFISPSKLKLCKIFNWDKKKKIATIFLHHLIDGNFQHGRRKFLDNYTWADYTLKTIKKIKNINWIVKQHPSASYYKTKINTSSLVKKIEKEYNHIKLFPDHFDPASLINITDVAITSHGTAGAEYISFGIPSILADKSQFTHMGFSREAKNIGEYKSLLKKAYKMNKPSKKKVEKAKIFMFIYKILFDANRLSILPPTFIITREIDVNKFWLQLKHNLKKFSPTINDQFKKMFAKQLRLKLRHTVNFDLCSIGNKIFNDY